MSMNNTAMIQRLAVSADRLTCVDLIQQKQLGGREIIDKHTLMTHSKAAANAALKELDVLLTLQQQRQHASTRSAKSACTVALHSYHLDSRNQRLHLLLEHCARGDLFHVAQQENRLVHSGLLAISRGLTTAERGLRRIVTQVLIGLRSLHRCGIAHMDVSLENVLVDGNHNAKLADFASSQRFQRDVHGRAVPVTIPHECAIAKQAYAAPELHTLMTGDAVTIDDVTKADVWSLGVMLWHLLTRVPLFPTGSATENDPVFGVLATQSPPWIDQRLPAATPQLRDLLGGLLDPNPATRLSVDAALQHAWLVDKQQLTTTVSVVDTTPSKSMADAHPTERAKVANKTPRRGRCRTVSAEISLDATRVIIRPSLLRKPTP